MGDVAKPSAVWHSAWSLSCNWRESPSAGCRGPDERLGLGVVLSDVFADGSHNLGPLVNTLATQPLLGDIAEEALDHVQPRRRGWRECMTKRRC